TNDAERDHRSEAARDRSQRAGAAGGEGFGMKRGATPRSRSAGFRSSIRSASLRRESFSHTSRSLLDIESLSDGDIQFLLRTAARFANVSPRMAPLSKRHVALLFYEA